MNNNGKIKQKSNYDSLEKDLDAAYQQKLKEDGSQISQQALLMRLLKYANGKLEDVDCPLCGDCADLIYNQLRLENSTMKDEIKIYKELLSKLEKSDEKRPNNNDDDGNGNDDKIYERDLKKLEEEELKLIQELKDTTKERDGLKLELNVLNEKESVLSKLENRSFKVLSEYELEIRKFRDERDTIQCQINNVTEQLERLKTTHVYNDAFFIWQDGHFGSINGFRLGRLPSVPVTWEEINAALGQVSFLLYTLAKRRDFEYKNFQISPVGSFSRIQKRGDNPVTYELYGAGDMGLSKFFWARRFDQGLIALLDCVNDFSLSLGPEFKLPYTIHDDKIAKISIKMGIDEEWTKACKYMLVDLKWILAYIARLDNVGI